MNGNEGLSASDVAVLTGSCNNGMGMEGGWGSMIWLFAILALMNGGFGGFGGNNALGYDFPWVLNGQNDINSNVNGGFRDTMLNDSINSIRDGINGLSTQLCGCSGDMQMALANGFAGVNQSVNGAQSAIAQQLYSNQIADMQQQFATQSAMCQGFNGVNNGIADVRYSLATESCATRNNDTQNTQAILNAVNAGVQSIKDQLCQDKIDEKNDIIAQLRQEALYARGQASQDVQTARLLAGQTSEVDALYNRLSQCPVPCMPVYGMTPIFQCNGNSNGCGCNGLNI